MKTCKLATSLVALCIFACPVLLRAQYTADDPSQPLADFQAKIPGTIYTATITTPSAFPSGMGQAIAAAFPKELFYRPDELEPGVDPTTLYTGCATVIQGGESGAPGLAAVSFNGGDTEIAALAYSRGSVSTVYVVPPKSFDFTGGDCVATTVNLADPAQSDSPLSHAVEISFQGADWFFIWNGQKLIDITAPEPDSNLGNGPYTDMADSDIVDIDRTGPMQIVGRNGDWDRISRSDGIASTGTLTLFRYNGKAYAPAAKYRFFQDDCGTAGDNENRLSMHRTPAPTYLLTVYNGARDGTHRATGATVQVNGKTVLGPGQINASVATVSQIVQLNHNNMIDVTTQGKGQLVFYVTIRNSK